jgi:hypothetical protein
VKNVWPNIKLIQQAIDLNKNIPTLPNIILQEGGNNLI